MASFVDSCKFSPTAGGTADFTYASAVSGYQSPASAGVINGALYKYRAESADLSQWEVGYGVYNTSTGVITRVVTANHLGNTSKINFSTVPAVGLVAAAADVGGLTNRRIQKTASYTVAQIDSNATIALGGSAFYTLIFLVASGYDPNHINKIINEDTARAKMILPVYTSSSSSITIGTGSKAFTVAAGLYFSTATTARFRAFSLANPTNFVSGTASYSGTTLTFTVDAVGGSGTFTDWQIAPEMLLWPRQKADVFIQNGAWNTDPTDFTWMPDTPQVQFNINPSSGVDCNDGLATGSGNALKTMQRAVDMTRAYLQFGKSSGGSYSVAIDGGSNTIQEQVQVYYPLSRSPGFIFRNMTWRPANSGYALVLGDGAFSAAGSGIVFDGNGATTPIGYVFGHGDAIFDSTEAVLNITTAAITGSAFTCDSPMRWNFLNGITITNAVGAISRFLYEGVPGSNWNINGTHTFVGNPGIGRFIRARGAGCEMELQGNVSFSGANTCGQSLVNQNGVVLNLSGATFPGGSPSPTTGGQYNTSDAT